MTGNKVSTVPDPLVSVKIKRAGTIGDETISWKAVKIKRKMMTPWQS
jgi:hypothetical protein